MQLDRRFKRKVQARFERFEAEVGVLQDRPHMQPQSAKKGLVRVEGGPARRKSFTPRGTVMEVATRIRRQHNAPYLTAPFRARSHTPESRALNREIGNLITNRAKSYSKFQTALRALIRVPILRGKYGRNKQRWAKIKTFNRFLIDTGQFFRAIIAKVRSRRSVQS